MARKTVLVSDFSGDEITGSPANLIIKLPEGTSYELDITPDEARSLLESIKTELQPRKRRGRPPKAQTPIAA